MANDEREDDVLRRNHDRLSKTITTWVHEEYKRKYDILADRGVRAAEHMRRVMYPEIDRLWRSEGLETLDVKPAS